MTPTHDALAARLRAAYAGTPVPPLRDGLDPLDGAGAYAVQAINTAFWRSAGRTVVGRKIGLTAKAVQVQLGVDQPDFGVLFDDMAIANGGALDPRSTLQPKAEAEVAFVMARDFSDPNATREGVADAIAYALPAIEIVDSRISDWRITFADTVADNGSSGFFVLGDTPRKLDRLDLRTCGMAMSFDDEVVSLGAGAACLGHPLNAAAWLARTLANHGTSLKAGDVVLTGALGPMATLRPGIRVHADIGGLGGCGFTFGDPR